MSSDAAVAPHPPQSTTSRPQAGWKLQAPSTKLQRIIKLHAEGAKSTREISEEQSEVVADIPDGIANG